MPSLRAAKSGLIGTCCLLLLQACAGNGQGLDANGRPLGESSGGTGGGEVSADFVSIQANVFTPICSVCHIGGGAPEGLRLDEANAYNLLVNVPSTEVPSLMRVTPGDPDSSYLIQKLEGHAAVGARMPLGGPYLSDTTIASIRQWITAGAATAAPATVEFRIRQTLPATGEVLREPPAQLAVAFSHALDVTQLGALSARLTGPTGRVALRLSVPSGNEHVLLLTPQAPLVAGHYALDIGGPVGPQVRDERGETLWLGPPDAGGRTLLSDFDVELQP